MAGIKDYSSTAGSNTSIGGISIAEGMLPSNINNAFRGLTADIREWYNDSQWVIYGDGDSTFTITYASATSFTVSGVVHLSAHHLRLWRLICIIQNLRIERLGKPSRHFLRSRPPLVFLV